VFLPGSFDKRYFEGTNQRLVVTGVQRLEGLSRWKVEREQQTARDRRMVVLNVNFSYGVLVDKREQWISDVHWACREAGYELVISQHPQDDGDLSSYEVSKKPLYDLLVEADFFVSRFSGAILEALVIGCPVIYYNGHGERIDKFYDGLGAYDSAKTREELFGLLRAGPQRGRNYAKFLTEHGWAGGVAGKSSVEQTVDAIVDILRETPCDAVRLEQFKASLLS
ncbi:MAG TPA: hypothetical protein VFU31_01275, partial [Candidatus Binatia bacterium]|nr:hypothetical protein [Candidatus Binatia bacterium]